MIYLLYFLIALAVVMFSIKCANYVDLIDKKTHISGAFIGGIVLAAVTSLPELITSLSSIFIVKNHELVIGNVLGSNLFNLAVLGCLVLFTAKYFKGCITSKSHISTFAATFIIYIFTMLTVFFGFGTIPGININITSIIIVVLYIVSFKIMTNATSVKSEDEEDNCTLTVKQIVVRFIIVAVLLVCSSIAITYVTDIIASELNLNASLAGALFLGIATSLPELTSSVTLVRKKNYNATIGNIAGSNIFNYLILVITDVLVFGSTAFVPSPQTNALLIFGLLATFVTIVMLLCKIPKINKKIPTFVYAIFALVIFASYFLFLVFSM